jgi:hypothetical protein
MKLNELVYQETLGICAFMWLRAQNLCVPVLHTRVEAQDVCCDWSQFCAVLWWTLFPCEALWSSLLEILFPAVLVVSMHSRSASVLAWCC